MIKHGDRAELPPSHMCRTVVPPCSRLRVGQLAMMPGAKSRVEWGENGSNGAEMERCEAKTARCGGESLVDEMKNLQCTVLK